MTEPRAAVHVFCPHCKGDVAIAITVEGAMRDLPMTAEERAEIWLRNAPPAVRDFLDELETAGVMASFRSAVDSIPNPAKPTNLPRLLLKTAALLQPYALAPGVMARLREAFGPTVAIWQANAIIAVTQNGTLAAFTSMSVLKELRETKARVDFTDSWIKTRFGYVVTPYLFDEFRRKSIGAWDALTKPETRLEWTKPA